MRIKITLWVIAIIACIALGIRQKENLSIFLCEYNALWRDTDYHDESISFRRPLIPKNIVQADPEAAKIAEHLLEHHERDEWLLSLADGLLKYPRNEFLLDELANPIWYGSEYGCQIRLGIAKRLISLNLQKPFYHYFLADALLDCGSDMNTVLYTIELGNQCSDYNIPYDKYRQRVINIGERAKLSRMQIGPLESERMEQSPFDLDRKLIRFAAAAFADGNNLIGTRICDTVYEMQRKHFLAGDLRAMSLNNLSMMGSFVNFGNWYYPEGLELQRVELSKERARKDRLRLCARVPEFLLVDSEKSDVGSQNDISDERKAEWGLLATMLAPYFGKMFLSFGLVIFILTLFYLAAGNLKNERVGFFKILLFAFACFVFFLVARGVYIRLVADNCGSSYTSALRPFKLTLDTFKSEPGLTLIFLVMPAVGLLFLQISRKGRWMARAFFLAAVTACAIGIILRNHRREFSQLYFEDLIGPVIAFAIIAFAEIVLIVIGGWLSKCRIVWLAVSSAFFGGLSIAIQGYFYLEYSVMLLFILFSAAMIVGPAPKDKSPIAFLFTLFGTDAQRVTIRVKCLKLVAPFIVVYWLIFVYLMPASVYRIVCESGQYNIPRRKHTLLEPNEATYQQVLNYVENKQQMRYGMLGPIGLVKPEDLPDVLEKIKAIPSDDRYGAMRFKPSRRGRGYDPNRPVEPNAVINPERSKDALFTRAITSCGRDVVNIITAYISDPNQPRVLLARAKLGDVAAKQPLEQLLAQRIAEGNDFPRWPDEADRRERPMSSAEIIPALACISEPNEAAQRYISLMQRNSMPEVIDDRDFTKGFNLLPTQQARVVIKAYIAKAADWQTPPDREIWPSLRDALNSLRDVVGFYADREIAEGVFRLMLRVYGNEGELRELNISRYFTIESAELLKKGLTVPNYRFRAWCEWNLKNVGYEFTDEELSRLLKDDSWVVRANAVMAEPQKTKDVAAKDKNSFVRFVATLTADSQ